MHIIYSLDTYTLNVIFMMLHFSVAMISILTLFVYDKNYLKPLAIGYSISLLGFLCLAFQGTGIPFVTIVLGNTFVMLGTILVGHGLLRIINKSVPINIGIGIVAIHFITFCYFTFMHPSMPVRVIIMSLEAILVTGYIGILFGAQFLTKPHIITALMSCIHLLYMPVLVIRIINVINVSPYVWILNDHNYALIQFWTIIITFFRIIFTVLLVANDFEKELTEKNHLLHKLSYTDTLTGLHNVRSMLEKFELECSRIERYNSVACIALIDLDHFKQINDTHGHIFGDKVLQTFAKVCIHELRTVDVVSRYGGEEFLILMPETNVKSASDAIHRLRKAFQSILWEYDSFSVTFSTGLLEVNELNCSEDIRFLIDQADQAMYIAKSNGRDRIEVA